MKRNNLLISTVVFAVLAGGSTQLMAANQTQIRDQIYSDDYSSLFEYVGPQDQTRLRDPSNLQDPSLVAQQDRTRLRDPLNLQDPNFVPQQDQTRLRDQLNEQDPALGLQTAEQNSYQYMDQQGTGSYQNGAASSANSLGASTGGFSGNTSAGGMGGAHHGASRR